MNTYIRPKKICMAIPSKYSIYTSCTYSCEAHNSVSDFIGFIFSAGTIWNENLMYLQSFSWIIGALTSSVLYYLLTNKQ